MLVHDPFMHTAISEFGIYGGVRSSPQQTPIRHRTILLRLRCWLYNIISTKIFTSLTLQWSNPKSGTVFMEKKVGRVLWKGAWYGTVAFVKPQEKNALLLQAHSCNKSPGTLAKFCRAACFISTTTDGAQSRNTSTRSRTFQFLFFTAEEDKKVVNLRHSCPITQSEGAKTFVTGVYHLLWVRVWDPQNIPVHPCQFRRDYRLAF